jgi:hypothetical protein
VTIDIEDRVRSVLAEAVAHEPPLRGAPLDHALRRRRRRLVVAGAAAMALVLAAVVAVALVRTSPERAPLSTVSTKGWKTYTDVAGNLRFRYPPGWRLEVKQLSARGPRYAALVPPGVAVPARPPAPFEVTWQASGSFWIGEDWVGGTTSMGRLPNGRPYLHTVSHLPADDPYRFASWSIDWGRPCLTGAPRCAPRSVRFQAFARDGRLWDRYRAVADTIPTTVEQLRPTAPTVGDLRLPACRADQWRLVWVEEYGMSDGYQGTVIQGGVRYRQGPRCHLRLTLRMAVEDGGGRRLPVRGNPASTTVEGDLPVDGLQRLSGSWVIGGALMWRFMWHEWCNRGLPQASLRVTADGGATLTVPGWTRRARSPRGHGSRSAAWTGAGPRWSPAGRRDRGRRVTRAYGTSVVASGSRS